MSISLLIQANTEIKRLAIAGSKLAKGDFRLQRLIEPIGVIGEKVAVFKKVAETLQALLESDDSPQHLLQASTLINAVLVTQAQTILSGNPHTLTTTITDLNTTTTISARQLRPVLEALTTSGSGRQEIIEEAFKRGLFTDLRLIVPALNGLNDTYPPVADFIADTILPTFGHVAIPTLEQQIQVKGKITSSRALRALHRIVGEECLPLLKELLENGSPEMRVTALGCLKDHTSAIPLIKEQCTSRNKQVRQAALEALSHCDDSDVVTFLINALTSQDSAKSINPILTCRHPDLPHALIKCAKTLRTKILSPDVNEYDIEYFYNNLLCLLGHNESVIQAFVLDCLQSYESLQKIKGKISGEDLWDTLVKLAVEGNDKRAHDHIIDHLADYSGNAFGDALRCLINHRDSATVYERLHYDVSRSNTASRKPADQIIKKRGREILHHCRYLLDYRNADSRWAGLAITLKNDELLMQVAQAGQTHSITYLRQQLKNYKVSSALNDYLLTLIRCQDPEILAVYCELVRNRYTNKKHQYYYYRQLIYVASHFDKSALPCLEALAAELPEDACKQLLEALEPLCGNDESST